jgi:hypothetical protein
VDEKAALILVRTIADLALFLEFTDAGQLDEDASVEALEQMASSLQDLTPADREAVARLFQAAAKAYPDSESATYVAGLPEAFGLT